MATVATGVPSQYPLALNTPLDRAYLRPLQEPLYDTEEIPIAAPPTQFTFFQRPISQNTAANLLGAKTEAETNINQSSMLDYPREFSILGFNVALDSTTGFRATAAIYRRAWFQFTFSGRRPYLQIPLNRIPAGLGLQGVSVINNSGIATNGMGHVANYYKFNLGRAALKIKPGEAFNARITYPTALIAADINTNYLGVAPVTPASYTVQVFIVGLSWSPL